MNDEEMISFPIPEVTGEDRSFWEGAQADKLMIQKCLDCDTLQYFPRPVCVRCFGMNLGWHQSEGEGTVYSFAPVHMPLHAAVRKYVEMTGILPVFAKVDLDEGVRILTEIIGCRPEDVKIGSRVKVCFEVAHGNDFKLPKFRLKDHPDGK